MTTVEYAKFIESKSQLGGACGFEPVWMPDWLMGFQSVLDGWAIRRGRAAIYADCGLGKTPMQLVWCVNAVRHENRPALIVAPLGVSAQTVREAEKFGIDCERSKDGKFTGKRIVVTNYERLRHFNPDDFCAVACDEAGCLKNFEGATRRAVTEFLRRMPYRLLCTATAAPNDFTELGTHAEALGELGHMDMLARFFKNDEKSLFLHGTKYGDMTQKSWRFKAHAEQPFWRWVCSWARACRKPSDLGFDDGPFVLPELVLREHEVKAKRPAPGRLFDVAARTLEEQREEQRRTIQERCEKVAELITGHDAPAIAWCHLNPEGDLLERLIPGAVQVAGSDPDDRKEEMFAAFAARQFRVLITKPKIGGFGMNWQHCAHQTFFPSHSFEQWYQCLRRSWRFGQTRPVTADEVTTEGSAGMVANRRRKADNADRMFGQLVSLMGRFQTIGRTAYGSAEMEVPAWL